MKRRFSLGFVITLMLLASALTWAGMVLVIGFPFGANSNRSDYVRDFSALLMRIEEFFIGDYDEGEVAAAAMRAAVAALQDNWSFYMTAEEFARNLDNTYNRFEGIGVNVESDDSGYIRVASVFSGSAADTAGILPGDLFMEVDGESVNGITSSQLREMLRRPIGETAVITVERADGSVEDIPVVFGFVFIDPISFELLGERKGFVRINNFNNGSAQSFINAVNELIELGAEGLVFDVRRNSGGWVTEMTEMLDFLLPEGEIFVMVDRQGNEAITLSGPEFIDLPMVVLVDRNSFSGAEYFAAMLSEYDFASVVGEQTTGKSRVQRSVRLPGGGAVNISFAEYLTKNRVSLHDQGGFTPDYIVILSDDERALFFLGELEFDYDPQLQKALQLLS